MLNIKSISKSEARSDILDYLRTHKEAYASDIADELNMDIDLVFAVLKELREEGIAE